MAFLRAGPVTAFGAKIPRERFVALKPGQVMEI
jgi:hypothetical protein